MTKTLFSDKRIFRDGNLWVIVATACESYCRVTVTCNTKPVLDRSEEPTDNQHDLDSIAAVAYYEAAHPELFFRGC